MDTAHLTGNTRYVYTNIRATVAALTPYRGRFDAILVPNDTSGLLVGPMAATELRKPLTVAIVKPSRCWVHARDVLTDPALAPGSRYLFVDDQIASGATLRKVLEVLRTVDPDAVLAASYQYQYDTLDWEWDPSNLGVGPL